MLVAFDLDGTLVDSSIDLADAGNALLASYDQLPLPTGAVVAMVGDGARELVRRLLTARGIDESLDVALSRFLAFYDERLLATTLPYDGIVALLDDLARRTRLAVLTNKPAAFSERLLTGLGLRSYFSDVVGGDSAFSRKPSPDGLIALIEKAGVSPERALMVGDSVADLRTARLAGARACLVRYGFGFVQVPDVERDQAAFVVDHPHEIAAIVDQLMAS
jgi:phosphoglycolate phosphatase